MIERQVIRDRVLFGPSVTIGVSLLALVFGVALLVYACLDSVEILFAIPELWALPLLLIIGLGTRFGSSKLCRIEMREDDIVGRTYAGRRIFIHWDDLTRVAISENRVEFSTSYSYAQITRAFGRFDEIADFLRLQCLRRKIKCKDEPEKY